MMKKWVVRGAIGGTIAFAALLVIFYLVLRLPKISLTSQTEISSWLLSILGGIIVKVTLSLFPKKKDGNGIGIKIRDLVGPANVIVVKGDIIINLDKGFQDYIDGFLTTKDKKKKDLFRTAFRSSRVDKNYPASTAAFQELLDTELANKERLATLVSLGNSHLDKADFRQAKEYYIQALALARKIGEREVESIVLNNLGSAWDTLGDSKKAIEYFERALSIDKEIYGERHPSVATRFNNLGLAWNTLGDSKKAIEYYEKALSIDKEIYGERHSSVATFLNNLGSAWDTLGDSKKAIEYIQRAYCIFRESFGDEHPHTKITIARLNALEKKKD